MKKESTNVIPSELRELETCTQLRPFLLAVSVYMGERNYSSEMLRNNSNGTYCQLLGSSVLTAVSLKPGGSMPNMFGFRTLSSGMCKMNLVWFDASGNGWMLPVQFSVRAQDRTVENFTVSSWGKLDRYFCQTHFSYYILNAEEELEMILMSLDPDMYSYSKSKYWNNELFTPASLMMAPQIRKLDEWGFKAFSEDDGSIWRLKRDYITLGKFTQPGSTPGEVFKVPQEVWEKFKNQKCIREWTRICKKSGYDPKTMKKRGEK